MSNPLIPPDLPGRYWLHQALACLQGALELLGSHLVLLKADPGSSLGALLGLVGETGARTVLATALYEPWLRERDQRVEAGLRRAGVAWRMVHSYCLRDPYSVSTQGVGLRGEPCWGSEGAVGIDEVPYGSRAQLSGDQLLPSAQRG